MKVAFLTTDNREHYKDYSTPAPHFGTAPEALLEGFAEIPDLEVHVISCTREPTQSPSKLAPNIYFHGLQVPKWGWIRTGYQGCIRASKAKLRQIQPDIVHGQGTEKDCAITAVFSGFPNVVTLHGVMSNMARVLRAKPGSYMWLAALLESYTVRKTAGVFCNSGHTEKFIAGKARRFWRVPNPVRRQFFDTASTSTSGEKPRLLNIGVISSYKRQAELLNMLVQLRRQGLVFEIVFVGHASETNPYAGAFFEKLRPLEKEGLACHLGLQPVDKLIELMDGSSALVHTPNEESFGLVIAEALARGMRVFGFDVGGVRDTAANTPGAQFVENGHWQELAGKIADWLRHGAVRSPESAGIMSRLYHPRVVAAKHIEIYREVLRASS